MEKSTDQQDCSAGRRLVNYLDGQKTLPVLITPETWDDKCIPVRDIERHILVKPNVLYLPLLIEMGLLGTACVYTIGSIIVVQHI
jgi:hypothetical protein